MSTISKEKRNEYQLRWREKHPEIETENHRKSNVRYREAHPDLVKAYLKRYRTENPDIVKSIVKRYQVKYYSYINECKRLRNILLVDLTQ